MRQSPWKLVSYAIIVLCGILAVVPNFISRDQLAQLPDWLPKEQITLGLDLRGGSQLLLEIDTEAVLRDRLAMLGDAADAALRTARIAAAPAKLGSGTVTVQLKAGADTAHAYRALSALATSSQ